MTIEQLFTAFFRDGGPLGAFALLFVWLLFDTRKESSKREADLMAHNARLADVIEKGLAELTRTIQAHDTWERGQAVPEKPSGS